MRRPAHRDADDAALPIRPATGASTRTDEIEALDAIVALIGNYLGGRE
ncbi:MAG TPA: hypothetical protein VGG82_13275 [Casimicrobiaceae bacterium]|jgi:hypothetical protein